VTVSGKDLILPPPSRCGLTQRNSNTTHFFQTKIPVKSSSTSTTDGPLLLLWEPLQILPLIIQSRARVTSRSNIADDNPSFVTLSHMKRNHPSSFLRRSQSCPNFSIFSVMVPVKLKEAAPFLPPLQFPFLSFFLRHPHLSYLVCQAQR
jgi:hypothetical protein